MAIPYNSTLYKNALATTTCTILAGETNSSILDFTELEIGTGTLVSLLIPDSFSPADLTFLSVDLSGERPDTLIKVTDGVTNSVPVTFINSLPSTKVTFPPFYFYSEEAIRIISSISQITDVIFTGYIQPITQGAA